jgi:hypothetical protein
LDIPHKLNGKMLDLHNRSWTAFVQDNPDSIAFHLPEWSDLISECYGYNAFVAAVVDCEDKICAGVPIVDVNSPITGRRWSSLPFTDFCSPLYTNPLALNTLSDFLIQCFRGKEVPRIEIRWPMISRPEINLSSHFVIHNLLLNPGKEEIFRKIHHGHKLDLKKYNDRELQLVFVESKADFNRFYDLHLRTRKRLGVPVQPKRFFDLLWSHVIDQGLGFVLLAFHGKEAISGGVFLNHNKTIIYKYSASNESYINLYPNKHLLWKAIQWGCKNGYLVFNFGQSPSNNAGLRYFKSGWGAQETELNYSYIGSRTPSNNTGIIGRVMGTIIQHSPLFVCRSVGELLYKHFG